MKKTGRLVICSICLKEFYLPAWRLNRGSKYCSKECYYDSKIGKAPWNKGAVGVQKPNKGSFGGSETTWSGTLNEYKSLHRWVSKYLGKPSFCELCGVSANGKKMHWANRSGEYKKEKGDWIRLCAKCHYQFDKQYERRVKNQEK